MLKNTDKNLEQLFDLVYQDRETLLTCKAYLEGEK